jgi:hypothetical protein
VARRLIGSNANADTSASDIAHLYGSHGETHLWLVQKIVATPDRILRADTLSAVP